MKAMLMMRHPTMQTPRSSSPESEEYQTNNSEPSLTAQEQDDLSLERQLKEGLKPTLSVEEAKALINERYETSAGAPSFTGSDADRYLDEEVRVLMEDHPGLTREEAEEVLRAFGM